MTVLVALSDDIIKKKYIVKKQIQNDFKNDTVCI